MLLDRVTSSFSSTFMFPVYPPGVLSLMGRQQGSIESWQEACTGPRDVLMGNAPPPPVFQNCEKSQPCCKRNGHRIFRDLLLVTVVGQMVNLTPLPMEGISAHL